MKRNGAADDSRPLAGVGKVGFYELLLYRITGFRVSFTVTPISGRA